MYKAVHRISGEEILTLSPAWRGRTAELRPLDHEDMLVCQGCRQAVRLKAGPHKKPHFAHKHLQSCSFGEESPRVLSARALLYDWLAARFPGEVDAEWRPAGIDLPRPFDCLARGPDGPFAFWIVDAVLKLETREQLKDAFAALGLPVTVVLLSSLLRPDPNHPDWILLSPTERDFLRQTPYDEIGRENRLLASEFGSTLYYLDQERECLAVFRSLERVHAPNVFSGRNENCPLETLSVSPQGDFVLPGEELELGDSRAARLRQVERVRRWLEPAPRAGSAIRVPVEKTFVDRRSAAAEMVTCVYCGSLTANWWTSWMEEGQRLGKCRDCLDLGHG